MKRIIIDLNLCQGCDKCEASCSYPYHNGNKGFEALRERIFGALICRRCEEHFCEKVCGAEALEFSDGVFKRNIFRCVSCYNCAMACPFGVIYKNFLVHQSNICDLCLEREPECIKSCPKGAVRLIGDLEDVKDAKRISDELVVINGSFEGEK